MRPICVRSLQFKPGRQALCAVLSLLSCALVLSSCAGNRGKVAQTGQSEEIGRTSASIGQDDLHILIDLARSDMAKRLGVGLGEVAIEGTEPLYFPSTPTSTEGVRQAGYVIRLTAGSQECQYAGRPLGDAYVLWREVE